MKNILKKLPFSAYLFFTLCLVFLLAPFIATIDPLHTDLTKICTSPDNINLLGTDEVGRDIFSRMLFGGRATFFIGLMTTIFACLIGAFVGLIAGYFGGKIDLICTQVIDISLAFPSLLLAIGFSIILPAGWFSVITALAVTGWASFARIIRSQTLVLKKNDYITAARSLGSSNLKIMFYHILPNCLNLIIVTSTMKMGSFMLAESGLSFLGLGVPPPYPTLGGMISSGRDYLFSSPWITILPGILIAIIVLIANMLGERIAVILNPKVG